MIKKVHSLFLAAFLASIALSYSSPQAQLSGRSGQSQAEKSTKLTPQLEFFAGVGYFSPSLKQWNDAIKKVNADILANGGNDYHAFQQVKDGVVSEIEPGLANFSNYAAHSSTSLVEANLINHLGIKYYFSSKISLALSVAYFKSDASTSFATDAQGNENQWPYYGYSISDDLTISQEMKSYPMLLTFYYQPAAKLMSDIVTFYAGGGVGFYFSTLTSGISKNYVMDHSKGKAGWEVVDISSDPFVADLKSNIRAKANPFGYHVAAGFNVNLKNIFINL